MGDLIERLEQHAAAYSLLGEKELPALLREAAAALHAAPTGTDEYLAYLEAAVEDAGFVIKHDGGALGDSNFRLEPKVPASSSIPLKACSEGPQESRHD